MVGEILLVMVVHSDSRIMRQLVTLYPQSGSRGRWRMLICVPQLKMKLSWRTLDSCLLSPWRLIQTLRTHVSLSQFWKKSQIAIYENKIYIINKNMCKRQKCRKSIGTTLQGGDTNPGWCVYGTSPLYVFTSLLTWDPLCFSELWRKLWLQQQRPLSLPPIHRWLVQQVSWALEHLYC